MTEVAPEPQTKQKEKVMVVIDGSECIDYALKWALDNLDDKLKSHGLIYADYSGVFSSSYGFIRKKGHQVLVQGGVIGHLSKHLIDQWNTEEIH